MGTGKGVTGSAAAEVRTSVVLQSTDSGTNSSDDSGKGSAESNFQNCSSRDLANCIAGKTLPTYAQVVRKFNELMEGNILLQINNIQLIRECEE